MSPLDKFLLTVALASLGLAFYHYINSLLIPIRCAHTDTRDMENVEFLKSLPFFALAAFTLLWFMLRQWG